MLLYIMRHGETDYNVAGRLQGWLEEPLNEKGRELARVTGAGLRDVHFELCITSPLARAYETAKIVLRSSQNEAATLITDDRLKEISFGAWEGLCCTKANFELPCDHFEEFFTAPFDMEPFPGGENVKMVCERTAEFYRELIQKEEWADKTILISTHGCAMRALLNQVYEDKNNFWHTHVPFNCAVNIVEVKNGIATLLEEDKIYYDDALCIERYK
ncbi:MAG: histidine phosphatase family protein [Lachnospiraceae bacterium]|nr:histidine phosphatase family protein [Lachnospiraceae bacterium]